MQEKKFFYAFTLTCILKKFVFTVSPKKCSSHENNEKKLASRVISPPPPPPQPKNFPLFFLFLSFLLY